MAATTWRAPDDLYERVRREAFESRRPINELLTEAMREWLDRHAQQDQTATIADDDNA